MGWLFQRKTKEQVIRELLAGSHDHAIKGNTVYALHTSAADPSVRFIAVFLIETDRRSGDVGYKAIDESMGPRVTDCPERLLAASTCMDKGAVEWREKCRAARREKAAGKKASAGWTEGKVLLWYGKPVTFLYHLPKGGKIAGRCSETGKVFAYRVSELREPEASAAA